MYIIEQLIMVYMVGLRPIVRRKWFNEKMIRFVRDGMKNCKLRQISCGEQLPLLKWPALISPSCLWWSRLISARRWSFVSTLRRENDSHKQQTLPLSLQGRRQHRALQRDGLHSECAIQPALGAPPAAAQTPALDRGPRGGRGLLQLGLQAA